MVLCWEWEPSSFCVNILPEKKCKLSLLRFTRHNRSHRLSVFSNISRTFLRVDTLSGWDGNFGGIYESSKNKIHKKQVTHDKHDIRFSVFFCFWSHAHTSTQVFCCQFIEWKCLSFVFVWVSPVDFLFQNRRT